jgi:hypothetical protein
MSDKTISLVLKAKDAASGPIGAVNKSLKGLKGAASTAGSALLTVGKVAALGVAAAAVAVVGLGPSVLALAGKLEQMGEKAKVVFGDQLGLVDKWAKDNAAKMGLTGRAAVGLAANFADLLVPMGFTRKAAAEMSTKVVGLSGALSRWSGGTKSAAEVSDILAKAMLGERDGLKELGISISDADVDARLLKNGTDKLTGAQLEQARATATQQLIFEKSKDAQDAYAKGSGGLLGIQAKLGAKFAEVGDNIALGLAPALSQIMTFVADVAIPAVANFIGQIQAWVDANRPLIEQIRAFVGGVLKELWTTISTVVTWIGNLVGSIAANEDAMNVLRTVAKGIGDAFGLAWGAVKSLIGFVADLVAAITSNKNVMSAFKTAWDVIGTAIRIVTDAVRGFIGLVNSAIDKVTHLIKITPETGGIFQYPQGPLPNPHAAGGWVGLRGPEMALLGEKGPEYVIPNHQLALAGRGGGQMQRPIIHISKVYLNKKEIAEAIAEEEYWNG